MAPCGLVADARPGRRLRQKGAGPAETRGSYLGERHRLTPVDPARPFHVVENVFVQFRKQHFGEQVSLAHE